MRDERVYARATYQTEYRVTFYGVGTITVQEGTTTRHTRVIADVKAVQPGDSATFEGNLALDDGVEMLGWSDQATDVTYGIANVTHPLTTLGNPRITISDVQKDMTLYPVLRGGRKISFYRNGEGASFVEPIMVGDPNNTKLNDLEYKETGDAPEGKWKAPVRAGYTFNGWYLSAEDGSNGVNPYDGSQPIGEGTPLKLYAGWTPQTTQYEVFVWTEVLNEDGSDPEKLNQPQKYAVAFSYKGEALSDTLLTEESFKTTLNAESKKTENASKISASYYTLNQEKLAETISNLRVNANGSTIFHVYYDLKVFKYVFKSTPAQYRAGYRMKHRNGTTDDIKDNGSGTNIYQSYTLSAKLDENISDLYPTMDPAVNQTNNSIKFVGWKGSITVATCPLQLTKLFISYGATNYEAVYQSSDTYKRYYYYDTLDGESTEGAIAGNTVDSKLSGHFFRGDEAFTDPVYANIRRTEIINYFGGVSNLAGRLEVPGFGLQALIKTDASKGEIYCYYIRHRNKLIFHNVNIVSKEVDNVQFGADLSTHNFTPDYKATSLVSSGIVYEFDGWYTDRAYKNKFDFTKTRMPDHDLELFAHWLPKKVTLKFNTAGGSTVNDQVLDMGSHGKEPVTPTYNGHSFLGWFDEQGVQVDFENRIFMSDVTLTAHWSDTGGAAYRVIYKDEIEGHQVPEDKNEYRMGGHFELLKSPVSAETHSFHGWRLETADETDTTTYLPGTVMTINEELLNRRKETNSDRIVFTAWHGEEKPGTVSITYHSNYPQGAVYTGEEETYTVTDLVQNADETAPGVEVFPHGTTNGFDFACWNTKADGSGTDIPASGKLFADDRGVPAGGTNHLYAKWKNATYDYTIRHMIPKADGAGYEAAETETKSGVMGDTVSASPHAITGMSFDFDATNSNRGEGQTLTAASGNTPATLSGKVRYNDGSGGLVLSLYYKRNTYTVSYVYDGEVPTNPVPAASALTAAPYVLQVPYGTTVTLQPDAKLDSSVYGDTVPYRFTSWHTDAAQIDNRSFVMPDHGVVLHGTWTAVTNTATFTVVHKGQNLGATGYDDAITLDEYDNYGTPNEKGTAVAKSFTGYSFDWDKTREHALGLFTAGHEQAQTADDTAKSVSGTIFAARNKHLTLTLFYKRNAWPVVYQYEGAVPQGAPSLDTTDYNGTDGKGQSKAYGASVPIAANPTLTGYTFSGWDRAEGSTLQITGSGDNRSFTMPDRRVELVGHFIPDSVNYTVYHYVEKLTPAEANDIPAAGGVSYALQKTETLQADSGSSITAQPAAYTGDFAGLTQTATPDASAYPVSGIIRGDGSLKLYVFYKRNEYPVRYYYTNDTLPAGAAPLNTDNYNGESTAATGKLYKTGQTVTVGPQPQLAGYTFDGWKTRAGSDLTFVTGAGATTFTMPARGVELHGTYVAQNNIEYLVKHYGEVTGTPGNTEATVVFASIYMKKYTKVGGTWYELMDAYRRTGSTGETRQAVPHDFTGFTTDWTATGQASENTDRSNFVTAGSYVSGIVTPATGSSVINGDLVLAILYKRNRHQVTYQYESNTKVPAHVNVKAETLATWEDTYPYGATVTVGQQANGTAHTVPSANGYTFSGWHASQVTMSGQTFTMPDKNVIVVGSFTPKTDTVYTIKHWVEALDPANIPAGYVSKTVGTKTYIIESSPSDASNKHYTNTHTTDTEASARDKAFTGVTFDKDATIANVDARRQAAVTTGKNDQYLSYVASGNNLTIYGNVSGDTSDPLVLEFFYSRNEYQVTYVYSGSIPTNVSPTNPNAAINPVTSAAYSGKYKYGDTVPVMDDSDVSAHGYTFSGWSSFNTVIGTGTNRTFTMPAADVTISGNFAPQSGGSAYKVRYYMQLAPGQTRADTDGYDYVVTTAGGKTYYYELPEHEVSVGHQHEYNYQGTALDTVTFPAEHYDGYEINWDVTEASEDNRNTAHNKSNTIDRSAGTISGTVYGDDSLVIAFYYDRLSYTVQYEYEGVVPEGVFPKDQAALDAEYEKPYAYGDTVDIGADGPKVTAPAGYSFSGWHAKTSNSLTITGRGVTTDPVAPAATESAVYTSAGSFKMPARHVDLLGSFTPLSGIPYKAEHYKELRDSVSERLGLKGKIGTEVPGTNGILLSITGNDSQTYYNVDGKYYERVDADTDTDTGTTGTDVLLKTKDYTNTGHYTNLGVSATNTGDKIKGDGSLVLRAFYDLKDVKVTYAWSAAAPAGAGALPAAKTVQAGETVTVAAAPATPAGYIFDGWHEDSSTGAALTPGSGTLTLGSNDVVLYGAYQAQAATYTIKHYGEVLPGTRFDGGTVTFDAVAYPKMISAGGKLYELMDAYTNSAHLTDEIVTAEDHAGSFAGFAYDEAATNAAPENVRGNALHTRANTVTVADGKMKVSGTVAGDNSLVLALLYSRKRYEVNYAYEGVVPTGTNPATAPSDTSGTDNTGSGTGAYHLYGEKVTILKNNTVTAPAGYTFGGWHTVSLDTQTSGGNTTITMPDRDVSIVGSFSANTDTKFTITHYVQSLTQRAGDGRVQVDSTWYEVYSTYTRTGTTDEDGRAHSITIDGMKFNAVDTQTRMGSFDSAYNLRLTTGGTTEAPTGEMTGKIYGNESLNLCFFYERLKYRLTYRYEGHIPNDTHVPNLNDNDYNTAQGYLEIPYGETVTINDTAITGVTGYTFGGWKTSRFAPVTVGGVRTFAMPAYDAYITGCFVPEEGGTEYYVHHYGEMLQAEVAAVSGLSGLTTDGGTYVDASGITYKLANGVYYKDMVTPVLRKGTPTKEVTAPARIFSGLVFDDATTGSYMKSAAHENSDATKMGSVSDAADPESGLDITLDGTSLKGRILTATGNGPLVLQLFYKRGHNTVSYVYEGTVPALAPALPAETEYTFGQTVRVAADASLRGYTFTGWHTSASETDLVVGDNDATFTMPNRAVVLRGSFVENRYTLSYQYTGTVPPAAVPPASVSGRAGETVTLPVPEAYSGYVFEGWKENASAGARMAGGENYTMPETDVTLAGSWIPAEQTTSGVYGKGEILTEIQRTQGTPNITVNNFNVKTAHQELDQLDAESGAAQSEKEMVAADGDTADLILRLSRLDESAVPAEDVALVKALLSSETYHGIAYLDISLLLRVWNSAGREIERKDLYDTREALSFILDVPSDLYAPAGFTRQYKLIRVHNYSSARDLFHNSNTGKRAELLVDWTASRTISYGSDLFCTYALAWKDVARDVSDNTSGGSDNTSGASGGSGGGPGGGSGGGSTPAGTPAADDTTPVNRIVAGSTTVVQQAEPLSYHTAGGQSSPGGRNAKTGEEPGYMHSYRIMLALLMLLLLAADEARRRGTCPGLFERIREG